MQIHLVKDYDAMSQRAFDIIANTIRENAEPVISLTTGASPAGLFELLVKAINDGDIDIANTVFLNIDEYVGNQHDVYTVHTFMFERLYNLLKFKPKYFDMFNAGVKIKNLKFCVINTLWKCIRAIFN